MILNHSSLTDWRDSDLYLYHPKDPDLPDFGPLWPHEANFIIRQVVRSDSGDLYWFTSWEGGEPRSWHHPGTPDSIEPLALAFHRPVGDVEWLPDFLLHAFSEIGDDVLDLIADWYGSLPPEDL